METKGKLPENWENDLWKSIEEQDVMELRKKLNEIQISTDNQLQSYNMNSAPDSDSRD
ncbi:MAG TPA: hypothetical protein VLQ91_16540 [Draconibacterium sp.]|nr:hypothetical protein [Draconibacterium sp.]